MRTDRLISFSAGYAPAPARADAQPGSSGHVKPLAAKPKHEAGPIVQAVSHPDTSAAASTESEEGRNRNHPLYSEGPHADGMFHCPFTSDPTCQHGPTKLKCNYEYESFLSPICPFEPCRLTIPARQQIHRLAPEALPLQARRLLQAGVLLHRLSPPA